MRITMTFTKRDGNFDALLVERDNGTSHIDCPKHGVLPRDLLRSIAESVLAERGFLTIIGSATVARDAHGRETDQGRPAQVVVDALVETLQAALLAGNADPADMRRLFRATCRARDVEPVDLSPQSMERAYSLMDALDRRWRGLGVGETMRLSLPV